MASTAANSAIDICSRALILIGADPITSFDDDTTEALVASNMYEDVARAQLCATRWRFATEQSTLALLADAPTGRFDVAHQLPTNLIMLNAVTINDNPIDYTIYGDMVFSNASSNDSLVADYIYRADEVEWPSYFTIAVEHMLASIFATSIARDAALAGLFEQKADTMMRKAKTIDAQQQITRRLTTSRFITERRS
jgi:hypothetical protein